MALRDYQIVGKNYSNRNKPENIEMKKRLMFMKHMTQLWKRKVFYAEKITGVIHRRLLREAKKDRKTSK